MLCCAVLCCASYVSVETRVQLACGCKKGICLTIPPLPLPCPNLGSAKCCPPRICVQSVTLKELFCFVSDLSLICHIPNRVSAAGVGSRCDQVGLPEWPALGPLVCPGQPGRLERRHPHQQEPAEHHEHPQADAGHCQPGPGHLPHLPGHAEEWTR